MLNKVEVGNLVRFYEYGHCGDIVEGIVTTITPHTLDNQLEVKQLFTNDIWLLSDKNVTIVKIDGVRANNKSIGAIREVNIALDSFAKSQAKKLI